MYIFQTKIFQSIINSFLSLQDSVFLVPVLSEELKSVPRRFTSLPCISVGQDNGSLDLLADELVHLATKAKQKTRVNVFFVFSALSRLLNLSTLSLCGKVCVRLSLPLKILFFCPVAFCFYILSVNFLSTLKTIYLMPL